MSRDTVDNIIAALFMLAVLFFGATMDLEMDMEAELGCTTDTECMEQRCPPPNDDPDCDGGPQAAQPARTLILIGVRA